MIKIEFLSKEAHNLLVNTSLDRINYRKTNSWGITMVKILTVLEGFRGRCKGGGM